MMCPNCFKLLLDIDFCVDCRFYGVPDFFEILNDEDNEITEGGE